MMKKICIKIMSLGLALAMIFGATRVSYAGIWDLKNPDMTAMLKAGLKAIEVTGPPTLPTPTLPEKPQPKPEKINIDSFTIALDHYLTTATGSDVTPKIISVSGEAEVRVEIEVKHENNTEVKHENNTEVKHEIKTERKLIKLKPEEYEVKYYRVHSFSEKHYEEVEKIEKIGEYKITVTAKDSQTYEGEASCLFSVIGKPQKLSIAKTKYSLTTADDSPLLQPKTDGDGTGFHFVSSDETLLAVSENGQTEIKKPGRAIVTVKTEGTKLYQPAKLQVIFEISPQKVMWDTDKMNAAKNESTLVWKAQDGATSYELVYCTEKKFMKPKRKTGESAEDYVERIADYTYARKTVKASVLKMTLKGLKKDTTYYVKVRALTETTDTRGNKRTMEGPWSSVREIVG